MLCFTCQPEYRLNTTICLQSSLLGQSPFHEDRLRSPSYKYPNDMLLLASYMVTPFADSTYASTPTALPAAILPSSWTAAYVSAAYPQSATDIAQIVNTLALYPLAVDGGNFSALSLVFTEDIIADYPIAELGILTPLTMLEQSIVAASANFNSQHVYGTQIIEITGDGQAKSLTYVTATLFGKGKYYGEVCHCHCIRRDSRFSRCKVENIHLVTY